MSTHAVTVHIPESLYRSARDLAQSRGISVAAFAREAIDEKTRGCVDVDLTTAYETLAADPEETDGLRTGEGSGAEDSDFPDYSALLQVDNPDEADLWGWDWLGPGHDLQPLVMPSAEKTRS